MKNIAPALIISILAIISCTKKENKIYLEGGTAPVLTSNVTGTIPLSFANRDAVALKLSWSNPEYKFTTGVSSQDVSYQIEFDVAGANFLSANKITISVSKELSKTFTQGDLNQYLFSNMKLAPGTSHNFEVRVKSFLPNNNAPLVSNTLSFSATPYAIPPKVAVPSSGKLYIVGSATNGDWNNPVPVPSQEFTRISNTLYEITLPLKGGGFYLLLPVNGDWGTKYGAMGGNGSNNPNGDDFRMGGGDFIAPAASGNYKITVDFQAGTFTVTKV